LIVDLDIRFLILQEIFMPRAWRIACEGALYRLLSLGNERHDISFDMVFQLGNDRIRQDGAPPFITLAKHMNTLAVEIDIFDPKAHALHESQTGAVKQFGHQRMGSLNISKQSPDFFPAEYGGQFRFFFDRIGWIFPSRGLSSTSR
jgi:hypothetical protein